MGTDAGLPIEEATDLLRRDLAADIGSGDVTSALTVGPDARFGARLVSRQEAVLCGVELFLAAFRLVSQEVQGRALSADGDRLSPGEPAAEVEGPAGAILAAERTALNIVTHLSGVATLTAEFVRAAEGTRAVILDTRKTLPGLRSLQKYAVRCGGGSNHRMGLFDRVLIKDNHAAAAGVTPGELARTAARATDLPVEVEVDSLDQMEDALGSGADIILLDNFSTEELTLAVESAREHEQSTGSRPLLEASGGVDVGSARGIALAGVDRISIGALTHSAPAADLGLDYVEPGG